MLAIKNNLMAEQAARQLGLSYDHLTDSVRRLSSGLRIVTAKDDAAGMAVRELIRADVATLKQGSRNAQDAISMLQTAEGAMGVIDTILVRLRELAEQASTESYSPAQRGIMNDEFQQLVSELDRITMNTRFNDLNLLNDEFGGNEFQIHLGSTEMITIDRADMTASGLGVGGQGANTVVCVQTIIESKDEALDYSGRLTWAAGTTLGSFSYKINNTDTLQDIANGIEAAAELANSAIGDSGQQFQCRVHQVEGGFKLKLENITTQDCTMQLGGVTATSTNGSLTTAALDDWKVGTRSEGVEIDTEDKAREALETVYEAIKTKDQYRAKLGYLINRLESASSVIDIQAENLLAAESRISDVDVAVEMAAMTRHQVLAQAGISMLSQANQMPQMALSLLQG
jgi:flagellin